MFCMVVSIAVDVSKLIWDLDYPDDTYLEPWSYYNNVEASDENHV